MLLRLTGVTKSFGGVPALRGVGFDLRYVPEDRRRHGVIPDLPLAANATLAVLRRVSTATLLDAAVGTLSGGNQQKVAVARRLATGPRVIILDEPTRGVDAGAESEIYRLIAGLADPGMAVLLISSELPEVLGLSHRVLVMRAGTIVGELPRGAATVEAVMGLTFGHAVAAA